MSKHQPIKRNENMVVFSHDHHHGLIFCNRLKKAKRTDEKTIREFIKEYWINHLSNHFEKEEKLLIPLLPKNEITIKFNYDHNVISSLISKINDDKNEQITIDALELSKLLTEHIRFEERKMFPWVEKILTKKELKHIGNELNNIEVCGNNFKPEFWKQ